jgi:hypothetical protein
MRTHPFFRRVFDLPVALATVAALVVVWWIRANRAEQGRWPHADVR